MKKRLLGLLCTIAMIMPIASLPAYAADPNFSAFYDFEGDTLPTGFSGGTLSSVDAEHGKSWRITTSQNPTYTIKEPINSGRFQMSFDVCVNHENSNIRIISESNIVGNGDEHSFFFIKEKKLFSMKQNWESYALTDELMFKEWHQVDIIFDFIESKRYYYVDGEFKYIMNNDLPDMRTKFTFRADLNDPNTGRAYENSEVYIDNLAFKYTGNANIYANPADTALDAESDILKLRFDELADPKTATDIKVYKLGTDPLCADAKEVDFTLLSCSSKSAVIKLSKPMGKSERYKVVMPNLKTIFDSDFDTKSAYFAAGGNFGFSPIVSDDFTSALNTSSNVTAGEDVWVKGGSQKINIDTDATPNVLRFVTNKGTSSYKSNYCSLECEFKDKHEGFVQIEVKLKAKNANQKLSVYDNDGAKFELFHLTDNKVVSGSKEICSYSQNTWFVIKMSIDTTEHLIDFYKDGESVCDDVAFSASSIKKAVFEQENYTETYGHNEITKDAYSEMSIEYFMLGKDAQITSLIQAYFTDESNKAYYPDEKVKPEASKLTLAFSNKLDKIPDGAVTLKAGDHDITLSNMVISENVVTFDVKDYLLGNTQYTLKVSDTIKDKQGLGVKKESGKINTSRGSRFCSDLTLNKGIVNAKITDTQGTGKPLYLVYAAFDGNLMIDYQIKKIDTGVDLRFFDIKNHSFTKPLGATSADCFIWDGFDTMIPLHQYQTETYTEE